MQQYKVPSIQSIPWELLTKEDVIDRNTPIKDSYCPICDATTQIFELSDCVLAFRGLRVRKVLYTCDKCNFLFSNEERNSRANFFEESPYPSEKTGHLTQREVDLCLLGLKLAGGNKESNILIYGLGYNKTVSALQKLGYNNVWGSDIADGVEYGDRIINIGKDPEYFKQLCLEFDVIVACEVWEHYARNQMNDAFSWLFKHLSKDGILIGTTSLWSAFKSDDPIYNAPHEWGRRMLSRWTYPYFEDHTAFYRSDNLRTLAGRSGMYVSFGYFRDQRVVVQSPQKRIIAFCRSDNTENVQALRRRLDGRHHNIFFY